MHIKKKCHGLRDEALFSDTTFILDKYTVSYPLSLIDITN